MIIGIDGNEANVKQRVGIGEYAFKLLSQFEKFQISNFKSQIYLKNEPISDMPIGRENWKYRVVGPKKLWTQLALPFDLFAHSPRPNVFFSPTHYAPRFSPVPTAISIMDLSFIHFPELFKKRDLYQLKNWTRYSAKKASVIFTISKSTKDDIIKTYNINESKVIVAYPGISVKSNKNKDWNMTNLNRFGIKNNYILFVGTLQPRKNIERLVEAFSLLSKDSEFESIQLVIVGKKGWLYEPILAAPKKYDVEDKVLFLDSIKDDDLPVLYTNALCFVLPSLYEGFGFPVLEAMQYGCPVVTSNVSSLPEVGGDAALYVNPEDVDDIELKIKKLLKNDSLRKELIKKGYEQVKKFNWKKTAEETLKYLTQLASK